MKIKKIISIVLTSFVLLSFTQSIEKAKIVTWDDLSHVGYVHSYSIPNNTNYKKPVFSRDILRLHNQEIQITGYVIPMDANHQRYFLSALPNSSCYFCGAAESHSVMVLNLKDLPQNYKMDEYLTFQGTLRTHTEMENLPYSLENAELVKNN